MDDEHGPADVTRAGGERKVGKATDGRACVDDECGRGSEVVGDGAPAWTTNVAWCLRRVRAQSMGEADDGVRERAASAAQVGVEHLVLATWRARERQGVWRLRVCADDEGGPTLTRSQHVWAVRGERRHMVIVRSNAA